MAGPAPLDTIRRWLNQPHRVCALWLGKHCVWLAWIGLLLAVISPSRGSGIAVCWLLGGTGLPCPGCGVMRSLSCGIRGELSESWNYHPMGLLILALFVVTATQSLLPKTLRARVAVYLRTRAVIFNSLYFAFVAAFVGFGAVRALFHCATDLMRHLW